ncbi:MAG TPA: cyclase family protein [Pyrinomonadaceae bacterium]|nr:cyclase family protein [Pyrinomonadaceae bacterium]
MIVTIQIHGRIYTAGLTDPIDISIPLNFDGPQPNAYGVEPASAEPCVAGELVGDTRRGGSCNFEKYTLIPHCNGTHTECVGHVTNERISIRDCLRDTLMPAILISIDPERPDAVSENYAIAFDKSDKLITKSVLEKAISGTVIDGPTALIVRTRPNDERRLSRQYLDVVPAYFTTEAMQFIVDSAFKHLLVDTPSIDRLYDEGRLSNHRLFWNIEPGSFELNANSRVNNTVTELIYVPNEIEDGEYLLNLQIAPFNADASPSRPVIFKLA